MNLNKSCQFNYPFLDMYTLEEIGVVGEWCVVDRHMGQIVIPSTLLPRRAVSSYSLNGFDCDRVEAKVSKIGYLLSDIMDYGPLDFKWVSPSLDRISDKITHPIARGLIKAMRKAWHTWKKVQSRYVLSNLSYQLVADDRLRIDLFPSHLVVSFWFNKLNSTNPCPHYRIIEWKELYGIKDSLRRVEYIRTTSLDCLKTGKALSAKILYLSDLYSESDTIDMLHMKVSSKENYFLHPQFGKWGRFTPTDDPNLWSSTDLSVRKIRV